MVEIGIMILPLLFALVGSFFLPDAILTPGIVDKTVTLHKVCATKWGKDVRHVTPKMKKNVCLAYGIKKGCPGPAWELDHRVPRDLGGADDKRNLWPQLWKEAHIKDGLEVRMRNQVCAGKISLENAQRIFLSDWRPYLKGQ